MAGVDQLLVYMLPFATCLSLCLSHSSASSGSSLVLIPYCHFKWTLRQVQISVKILAIAILSVTTTYPHL